MGRRLRINTAQSIFLNNVGVDDVYRDNQHIWPPRAYYVSIDGTDASGSNGDINNPFQTLNYAISRITDQNTIYFREGSYEFDEQEISNNGLSIQGYKDEKVTFDGTKPISDLRDTSVNGGNWQTHTADIVTDTNQTLSSKTIYKIKLNSDVEIWQLFYNRDEVINARYPSAQWTDEGVYDWNNWGHGYYNILGNGDIVNNSGSVLGSGTGSHYYYDNGEIVDVAHSFSGSYSASLYDFVTTQQGIDASFTTSGSMINLNVGSFRTYTKLVNSQSLDSGNNVIRLSYDAVSQWKEKHHYYYLENKLQYLNSENEWYFDNDTKYLYVWLPSDAVPSLTNIRAKQQSYSLNITANDASIENINFFSTTLKGNGANRLTVRDCNFLYASCYAHMLNQINSGSTIAPASNEVFETQTRFTSSPNVTFNGCSFRYTDGDVIHTQGGNSTIIDCYFNYIDKTVANLSSVMTTLRLMGDDNFVRNNTFRKTAASSTLNSGNAPIIEYNDLAESGYLQSDGAMIHLMTSQQSGSKVRYNWVHDTIKYGIRFDGDGEGFNGSIHHNIGWNCEGGIMAKGGILVSGSSVGGHFVYNNTFFNSEEKNDIMVLNVQAGNNINYGSVVMNNLSETLSGHRTNDEAFESWITSSNNFTASNVEDYLVNTASFDFRPINDNSIVDAANTTYTNFEFNPTGDDALTKDIGAMGYNGDVWEAGITWNHTTSSDGVFVTNNRLNFNFTGSTPTSWSPSTDITTVAWIDASDSSTYTEIGDNLTSVTDKSGTFTLAINGNPQTNMVTQNGLNVFEFDGSDDLTSTTNEAQVSSGNHWAIGVFRYVTVDSNKDSLWSYETNGSPKRDYAVSSGNGSSFTGELDLDGLSNNRISSTIGNTQEWDAVSLTQNQWHVVACFFNKSGNQIGVRVDGTNAFTPVNDYDNSLQTNQQLRIMRNRSSQRLFGKLGEFFAVADIPGTSGTDISTLEKAEGYLAHKWGLESSLPSDHPYKNIAP